jgi:glycosyltransferase involved in cell wall biosynthesis
MFLGFRRDVPEILATLDIFVSVSVKEGLGVSLLEASSYGVPIVAGNVGGIPEIVQDGVTGFLVPPRDSEALAEKIIHVLDHPQEARKMGENAREKIKNNFSVQDMTRSYTRLYQSMTKEE